MDLGAETDYKPNVKIAAEVIGKITFASQQNDVAVINSICLKNTGDDKIDSLILKLKSDPEIILERSWNIERIGAESEMRLSDRKVTLAASMLQKLTEKLTSDITFELYQDEELLATSVHQIEVLARNEWGGANYMPELLAAFVMPNDPAVEAVIKDASIVMRKAGEPPGMNGYQSKSRKRVYTIASSIWSAIASKRLTYSEPPASYEKNGQKIRTPAHIQKSGLATCLDTTVLFAAALEQAGINSLIAFTDGHAFCGAWLQPQYLPTLTTDDPVEIRKHIAAKELILFETTLVANEPPARFSQAIKRGSENIEEHVEQNFIYAVDIKQARVRGISPLPSFEQMGTGSPGAAEENYDLGLDAAPDLPSFDFGIEIDDAGSDTPETRVDHWRRKLLDLTKRNRLLNLRPTKTAIKLLCPSPAELEDKLADGEKITVIPKESLSGEQGDRDEELFKQRTGAEFLKEFASRAMGNNQIVADAEARDLERGMIELYRKSRADIREGGANTLFLAIGVLRWKVTEDDSKSYRAPLLLIPVKMERKSARSKVKIVHHDDEPVFNMTLLEMLRRDFEVDIPALAGDLPKDDSGIDVTYVWEIVRRAVKEIPGFEVREEVVISTFSFAKYLMWKDLSDRVEVLKKNRLVEHLIETPRDEYAHQADFLEPREIDEHIDPGDMFMPLPADSSQIVAVHASGQKSDFILEGPPGTGKSQTIANMIAHNLALGRKVLFVSEKMAALEVVYSRLKQHGLDDFCLELHSNKTNKKAVIDHLGRSWKNRSALTVSQWQTEATRLKNMRDDLNSLVQTIHEPSNGGVSPFDAIGRAVRYRDQHRLTLSWGNSLDEDPATSPEEKMKLEDMVEDLARAYSEIHDIQPDTLSLIQHEDWSYAWKDQVVQLATKLIPATEKLVENYRQNLEQIGLEYDICTVSKCETLVAALEKLLTLVEPAARFNLEMAFDSELDEAAVVVEKACSIVEDYRSTEKGLGSPLEPETVVSIDAGTLNSEWDQAGEAFFLVKFFKRRAVTKTLAAQASKADMDPERDLPVLIDLQGHLSRLRLIKRQIPSVFKWQGLNSDLDAIRVHLTSSQALKAVVASLAYDVDSLVAVKSATRKIFVDGRELLTMGGGFKKLAADFVAQTVPYKEDWQNFQGLAGSADDDLSLDPFIGHLKGIIDLQPRLNAWCRWQALKHKAKGNHLSDVVEGLTNEVFAHEEAVENFKTAYAQWLAPKLIDSREQLRTFNALSQEDKIGKFRELDARMAELSVDYIRAKMGGSLPMSEGRDRPKGFNILQHEMNKQRAHKPVRQLISEMGHVLTSLTPCMLMSPLSIAQFLPPDTKLFDVVIFDEASQITVWDAVGSIARANNVIIVGDPKQMPPSSSFQRSADSDDDDDDVLMPQDQESILTESLAAGVKHHRLTGHYRSKHESLIAFSNHAYYNGDLVTYPSCHTKESAVTLHKVPDGLYQRGRRINQKEANAVVAEVVRRLKDPELNKHSIGIVTMNTEQQRFINDLLDSERRRDPGLEPFFDEDNPEHVFVRNLETVQGDERNVIMISIGFGPTEPGAKTMGMNFGALSRKGGERRFNVLITRASEEMIIFCSFDGSMIDLTRASAQAIHDLKHYLDFAKRGPKALGEAVTSIGGLHAYDSDFERSVAEGLRARGWIVHTQIGVSKFRLDLGIVHPDKPGMYLAGVECDGATYHSLPSARDRDRVRHAILESLGWKLLRLWSTDFFQDPVESLDRLSEGLREILEAELAQKEEYPTSTEEDIVEALTDNTVVDVDFGTPQEAPADEASVTKEHVEPETRFASLPDEPAVESSHDPVEKHIGFALSQDRFYDDNYRGVVRQYATHIIDSSGPITFKCLADRIARDHGFKRTAARILGVVTKSIKGLRVQVAEADGSHTIWPAGQEPAEFIDNPRLQIDGLRRAWQDMTYPEKLGLTRLALARVKLAEAPREMANLLGLKRLTESTRTDFERAIAIVGEDVLLLR